MSIKRKLLSALLVIVMVATMIPAMTVGATFIGDNLGTFLEWDAARETFVPNNADAANAMILYTLAWNPLRPESVRWFPLIGELNLSRVFPTRDNPARPVRIAFRHVGDLRLIASPTGLDFTSASNTTIQGLGGVISITLRGRDARPTGISYSPLNGGELVGATMSTLDIMVGRAGTNGWTSGRAFTAGSNITGAGMTATLTNVIFPFGSTVEVRDNSNATITALGTVVVGTPAEIRPASVPLRLRIPAVPRAPRMPANPVRTSSTETASATTIFAIPRGLEFATVTDFFTFADTPANTFAATWTQIPDNIRNINIASSTTLPANLAANTLTIPGLVDGNVLLIRFRGSARAAPSFMWTFRIGDAPQDNPYQ